MKWIEVEFRGRKYRVPATKYAGRLWFHWQGETHAVDIGGAARRSGGDRGAQQPGVISAPMPGKVTRVNVNPGDTVMQGQALVVMEAMKMEYTLESSVNGQVKEVTAKAGAQVALGQVLVKLEVKP